MQPSSIFQQVVKWEDLVLQASAVDPENMQYGTLEQWGLENGDIAEEIGDRTAEWMEKIKGPSVPMTCRKPNSGRCAFCLFFPVVFCSVPVVVFRFVTTTSSE